MQSNLKWRQLHYLQRASPRRAQFIRLHHNRKNSHMLENRLSDEARPMKYHFLFGKMKAVSQPVFQIWRIEVWDYSAS
jgi:hypothetical protein